MTLFVCGQEWKGPPQNGKEADKMHKNISDIRDKDIQDSNDADGPLAQNRKKSRS